MTHNEAKYSQMLQDNWQMLISVGFDDNIIFVGIAKSVFAQKVGISLRYGLGHAIRDCTFEREGGSLLDKICLHEQAGQSPMTLVDRSSQLMCAKVNKIKEGDVKSKPAHSATS